MNLRNGVYGLLGSVLLSSNVTIAGKEDTLDPAVLSNGERVLQLQPQPRIINGTKTEIGRYPYQAIIGDLQLGRNKWTCSGSLIAPDVILTAAHCIKRVPKMGAHMGREVLYDVGDLIDDTKIRRAKKVKRHPDYKDTVPFENDVGLMFFRRKFKGFEPVLLNSNNSIPTADELLTVMGWGQTEKDGGLNDVKLEANATYDEQCGADLNITSDMFCATDAESSPCRGDSGGPIVSKGAGSKDDVMVGIVSWGYEDCIKNEQNQNFAVYARVADPDIYKWISEQVCEKSRYVPASFDCTEFNEALDNGTCGDSKRRCENRANEKFCKKRTNQVKCCSSCDEFVNVDKCEDLKTRCAANKRFCNRGDNKKSCCATCAPFS